tara:strand:- start:660 stop:911 length:252 start_codon:yes stop_codon:yes gene_type:complete
MNNTTTPQAVPAVLEAWSVDEVAECIDGVGYDAYGQLWKLVELDEKAGKPPRSLKDAWRSLDAAAKKNIIEANALEEADIDAD